MDEQMTKQYNNPFPVEIALIAFENGMKGEAARSLFETSRAYQEGLFVYGSNASFEWGFTNDDPPYITTAYPAVYGIRGRRTETKAVDLPNYHCPLSQEIQRFTVGGEYDPQNPQESLKKGAGGGHHGSHPHMVHEFTSSIVEERKPWIYVFKYNILSYKHDAPRFIAGRIVFSHYGAFDILLAVHV